MPLPFIAAVPPIVATIVEWFLILVAAWPQIEKWVMRILEAGDVIGLTSVVYEAIAKEAKEKWDIELDPKNPISEQSFLMAIKGKFGLELHSLKDPEIIKQDIARFAADKVEEKTQLHLEEPLNPEAVKRDVLKFACEKVGDKTGLYLTDPLNMETVKREVARFAADMLAGKTGLYLQDPLDVVQVRDDVIVFAVGKVGAMIDPPIHFTDPLDPEIVKSDIAEWGADLVSEMIQAKLDGRTITLGITGAGALMKAAEDKLKTQFASKQGKKRLKVALAGINADKQRVEMAKAIQKAQKTVPEAVAVKREKNRQNQTAFRKANGNRYQYIPVGYEKKTMLNGDIVFSKKR